VGSPNTILFEFFTINTATRVMFKDQIKAELKAQGAGRRPRYRKFYRVLIVLRSSFKKKELHKVERSSKVHCTKISTWSFFIV